jgi:hypothetical protein
MPDVNSRLKHDLLVIELAVRLRSQGWAVKARVDEWFEEPDVISGYRPDIVAQRGNEFLIVEVKKGPIDHPKIVALSLFVKNHPNYKLDVIELDDPAQPTYALKNAG